MPAPLACELGGSLVVGLCAVVCSGEALLRPGTQALLYAPSSTPQGLAAVSARGQHPAGGSASAVAGVASLASPMQLLSCWPVLGELPAVAPAGW